MIPKSIKRIGEVFGGKKNTNSAFWIPKNVKDAFNKENLTKGQQSANEGENAGFTYILQLAEIKRAIKNFVQILTNKNIPVNYLAGERGGFTDGKSVYISGDIDEDLNFDKTVGLALHEASHIVLSDIEQLKAIQFEDVTKRIFDTVGAVRKAFAKHVRNTKDSTFSKEKINYEMYAMNLKNLLNWVEDRRVDAYIQKDSPGYVAYYQALYDEYFNTKEIKDIIYSPKSRTPIFENYMFHVVNLISIHSDENALLGLKEIKDLVDFNNILRLKSMNDSFKVAVKIFEIILKNIDLSLQKQKEKEMLKKLQKEAKKNSKKSTKGKQQKSSGGGQQIPMDDDEDEDQDDQDNDNDSQDNDSQDKKDNDSQDKKGKDKKDNDDKDGSGKDKKDNDDKDGSGKDKKEVAKNKKQKKDKPGKYDDANAKAVAKAVNDALDNIKTLLNHEIEKQELPSGISNKIHSLSGMKVRTKEITMTHSRVGSIKTRVILVPELTKSLIDQNMLPITTTYGDYNDDSIKEGTNIGKKLVNKIKIRNESRSLITPRQKTGRLQQRNLADLSYDSENVFYRLTSEEFKSMHFHISVDASGSMAGRKWAETIKLLTSITYSACKIKNIDVVVDFRSWLNTGGISNTQTYFPFVLTAFDSRTQSFATFCELIKHVTANGMTPEGMCFQAMLDEYVPGTQQKDSVFINISDGSPGCTVQYNDGNIISSVNYSSFGIKHTAEIVKRIKKMNIEVISYYINSGWGDDIEYFKKMYGRDAKQISPNDVIQIAKSINEKLLRK